MNILEATVEMQVNRAKHIIVLRRARNESGLATLALKFIGEVGGPPWRYLALDGDHRTDWSRVTMALSSQFHCRVRDLGTNSEVEDVVRTFQSIAGV